jgi:hypothetical protein
MALETGLKDAALRVARSFHGFAKAQGWPPGSYRLFMSADPEWNNISVTFVADGFEGQDEQERYDDVRDFLEEDLSDEPELERMMSLVIYGTKEFESYGRSILPANQVEIDGTTTNPTAG